MPDTAAQRILVVIPCRNEAGRIRPVVESARRVLRTADVIVVDDESSDDTCHVAAEAGATVLPLAVNLGYGGALETGYLHALNEGYAVVLQMDGDGQHLAEELSTILGPVADGSADLVIGSRYLGEGSTYASSTARRVGQLLFGFLVRLATGRRFTDPTSGFQALGPRAIQLFATGRFPNDYPDADMLLMAHLSGLRIEEVPVRMEVRAAGASMHSGLTAWYYVIKMLLSMWIVFINRRELRKEIEHVYST